MRTTKLFSGDIIHHGYDTALGLKRLSLESEVVANVIETFRNMLPSFSFNIKEVLSTFGDKGNGLKFDFNAKSKKAKDKAKHVNFSLYHQTLVTTPEGFKGTFLEYAVVLNKVLPDLFSNANELLGEYNFVLSSFITNKENKTSLKDYTTLYKQAAKLRESVMEEMNRFLDGSDSSKKYLGDVLIRFSDLDNLTSQVSKIEKLHSQQNLHDIKASVDKAVGLLDIVIKEVQDNDVSNVSGAAAKNIAEGAYEIAKLVEMLSLVNFRVNQFLTSVDGMYDTITELK